jgi:hypothetical protein
MSNKKLTQLTEKITSLSADDLLYVSVNGESKSIRASVLEAPLKTYADQKKSEVITEIEAVDSRLDTEISNRSAADFTTLELAKAYADAEIAKVSTDPTPVGVMQLYAGETAPTGYLLCNGSAVSRSTYSGLFSVVGTNFGAGNGTTTFNLPNPDSNVGLVYIIKF